SDKATEEIFLEAAHYYLEQSKPILALQIMKNGIEKLASEELIALYEGNRYKYRMSSNTYENVTAIYGISIGVQLDGKWGLAASNGTLVVPNEYEKISTYSIDRAIVRKDGEVYAIDSRGHRLALLKEEIID